MTGLLQREAESSRLVGRDGVPASVAVVGTGVWPGISSEFCVLSVKAGRLSPGPDRERLPGTWPWKLRWAPLADSLLTCAGEVAGTLLCGAADSPASRVPEDLISPKRARLLGLGCCPQSTGFCPSLFSDTNLFKEQLIQCKWHTRVLTQRCLHTHKCP